MVDYRRYEQEREHDRLFELDGLDVPPSDEEPLIVIDEDDLLYVEEETGEAPAPLAERIPMESCDPAFPPPLAREVRQRAWAQYAATLDGRGAFARPRRMARRPRSRLRTALETLFCVGALIAINVFLFPGDPGFRRLEFNPYFLPVVLLALRYGAFVGTFTGAICAAFLVVSQGRVDLLDGSLVLPGLLVAVGAAAGILSDHQSERLAFFRAWSRKLEKERVALLKTMAAKNAALRDLQGKLEEHSVSLESLYQMSRGMSSSDPGELYPCILDILACDMKAERAAVYELEGDRFVLRASFDHRVVSESFAAALPAGSGLMGLAARENRVVSLFDPEAQALRKEGEGGVLCGAIHGRVFVWIREMPLLEFNPAVVARFSSLLRWAGESRGRTERVTEARVLNLFDESVGAYRPEYLREALTKEMNRTRRYGTSLRIMMACISGYESMPPARRPAVRLSLSRALYAHTRDCDTVCCADREDTFAVILPMYDADPSLLADRVNAVFEAQWADVGLHLSYRFTEMDGKTGRADDLLDEHLRVL